VGIEKQFYTTLDVMNWEIQALHQHFSLSLLTYLHIPSLTHIKLEIKITNNKKSLIPKQVDS
jgi:hypothetical protein